MKNKFLKFPIVLILCLVILSGCSVVPSSTPTPPASPDNFPAYNGVIDATLAVVLSPLGSKMPQISSIQDTLLEKFSVRLTLGNVEDADIVYFADYIDEAGRNYPSQDRYFLQVKSLAQYGRNYIDFEGYLEKMPNYTALFGGTESFNSLFYEDDMEEEALNSKGEALVYRLSSCLVKTGVLENVTPKLDTVNFAMYENTDEELIRRFIAFLDWSCTEEGIIASVYGKEGVDFEYDANGKIALLTDEELISPAAADMVLDEYVEEIIKKYR